VTAFGEQAGSGGMVWPEGSICGGGGDERTCGMDSRKSRSQSWEGSSFLKGDEKGFATLGENSAGKIRHRP